MQLYGKIQFEISEHAHPYLDFMLKQYKLIPNRHYTLNISIIHFHVPSWTGDFDPMLEHIIAFIERYGRVISLENICYVSISHLISYHLKKGKVVRETKLKNFNSSKNSSLFFLISSFMLGKVIFARGIHVTATDSPFSFNLKCRYIFRLMKLKEYWGIRFVTTKGSYSYSHNIGIRKNIYTFVPFEPSGKKYFLDMPDIVINDNESRLIEIGTERYPLTSYAMQLHPSAPVYRKGDPISIGDGCSQCKFRLQQLTGRCNPCLPTITKNTTHNH